MKITMETKKLFLLALAVSLIAILTVGASAPKAAAEKPIVLRVAAYLPEDTPTCVVDKWWMQEVERRTNKAVKFEYYPAGALLKAPELLPGIKKNLVQVGASSAPGYHPAIFRLYKITENLLLTEDPTAFMRAYMKLLETTPELRDEFNREGAHVLYTPSLTTMLFATKKKVTKMEDLKGLKIRAVGVKTKLIHDLGAVPVALTPPEVYDALHKGVIDGVSVLDFGSLYSYKLYEVLPYIIDTGFGVYATLVTVMNIDTWRGLPGKIQEEITEVSAKAPDKFGEIIMDMERRSLDGIKAAKGQIIRLAPEEKARWATVAKRVMWEGWIKEGKALGVPGEEWLDRFHKLCKEYEKGSKYRSVYDVWEKEYPKK